MNPILVMSKHELKKVMLEKWYIISTVVVLFMIIFLGSIKLPTLIEKPDFLNTKIAVFDNDNTKESLFLVDYLKEKGGDDYTLIFAGEEYDISLVIPEGFSSGLKGYNTTLTANFTNFKMSILGVTTLERGDIRSIIQNFTVEFVESELKANNISTLLINPIRLDVIRPESKPNFFPFIFLFMIFQYALMAGTSIRREKTEQTFELLASTPISYSGIFLSKIITYCTLFSVQFFIWSSSGILNPMQVVQQYMFILPALVFFISLYVGLSAMIDTEGNSTMLETLITVSFFFFIFFPIKESVKIFFMLFPLTSAVTMVRVLMIEAPSVYMFIASLVSTLVGTVFIVWLSARVFRKKVIY